MAQRRFFGRQRGRDIDVENQPYDGRFTFVRVKYTTAPGGFWYRACPRGRTVTRCRKTT